MGIGNKVLLLSHALAFAAGLIIHSLINREDCGDVVLKEISKSKSGSYNASATTTTALRPQPTQKSLPGASIVELVPAGDEAAKKELSFFDLGLKTGTDKVLGQKNLPLCLKEGKGCSQDAVREECRPFGHFYHTLYQQKLGSYYSRKDAEPFQFLEVGFFHGNGYDTYREFLPRGECHSIEISCLPHGDQKDGKWPWGNFAEENPRYQQYLDENLLHCGDGNDVNYLMDVWTKQMKRPGAPPLKVVVDDGSHLAEHMAQTVLFWLPRIEPGGLLFVEDIQPTDVANAFATQFMPQLMKDLHYCGNKEKLDEDEACFPTLVGMIQSIHCEMHICVIERNDKPAKEPTLEESKLPANALDMNKCKSKLPGHW